MLSYNGRVLLCRCRLPAQRGQQSEDPQAHCEGTTPRMDAFLESAELISPAASQRLICHEM